MKNKTLIIKKINEIKVHIIFIPLKVKPKNKLIHLLLTVLL